MKLSEWLFNYRKTHALSMQAMADLCGLSKQYISVLEKGINPNTKKEFIPSIETIKKIADATSTDFNALISLLGPEQSVTINSTDPFPRFDNPHQIDPETIALAAAIKDKPNLVRVARLGKSLSEEDLEQIAQLTEYLAKKQGGAVISDVDDDI